MATSQGEGGARGPRDAERRLVPLLLGQKEVFERMARGVPLPQVLNALVRVVESQLSGDVRASVLLLDEDGRRLTHGAAPGLPEAYNAAIDGLEIGPEVGSCGTAAFRGERVIVADIATDPLWSAFRELALGHGLRSCWSMPIVDGERRVLGTFAVYGSVPGGPADADLAALETFAQTAAVAIERDRDLTAILREKRTAEALNTVGRAIAARLELDEIVQLATDAATELTGAQFGAFFYNVVGDDGEAYQLYTLSGAPREAFERFPMPRATQVFAPTFNGEAPVRLADVMADPRYGRNAPYRGMPSGHLPVRSYLAVPVTTSDDDVAGGLFFGHSDVGVFDAEAERLAVGIAGHAAIAIENARLYASAQREIAARRRAFEERDRVARTLQASLLPPSVPAVDGLEIAADYHAAGEGVDVLGDFYDVFSHGPDRWAFVIGDVCGKGINAAHVTALARHTVRAAAMHADSPAEVLRTLNEATLAQADQEGLFITAIYADVDLRGPEPVVRLCCAGHPPALVVRADGGVVDTGHHGPLLGAFPDVELCDVEYVLAPGDALVLVTDGVIEARAGGSLFGEPRLRDVLAAAAGGGAAALVEAVTGAVVAHAGERFADDVAVLAVRVPTGSGAGLGGTELPAAVGTAA